MASFFVVLVVSPFDGDSADEGSTSSHRDDRVTRYRNMIAFCQKHLEPKRSDIAEPEIYGYGTQV